MQSTWLKFTCLQITKKYSVNKLSLSSTEERRCRRQMRERARVQIRPVKLVSCVICNMLYENRFKIVDLPRIYLEAI